MSLSSGLRVTQLGDDPVAASQALQLSSAISRSDTFVQTASRQSGALQVADATLGEVVTQLTAAISLGNAGERTGRLSASNRLAIVTQLQVYSKAGAFPREHKLPGAASVLAGSQGGAAPFTPGSLDRRGDVFGRYDPERGGNDS